MGYQIKDRKTGYPATEFRCFIRNLTIIAWPIEAVFGFVNPQRRIGDLLANTEVVKSEKEKLEFLWDDLKKIKISFIMILAVGFIYTYGFGLLMPQFMMNQM